VRRLLTTFALALLAVACGGESAVVERLAASAPAPVATPSPTATPEPTPPPSASSFVLAGDIRIDDRDPAVVVEPLPSTDGHEPRLRVEVRHRVGGSSQPDAVLVFLNVPPRPGTYALRSPEEPLVAGRIYAFVTTRGEAVGSMKDFNSAVSGSLTLRREADVLTGSFHVSAQEPPPAPPPAPLPGQPPPRPAVGTIPPARVEASGTLLARLPPPPPPAGAVVPEAVPPEGPTGGG
jgi:hypothetical protein